MNRHLLITSLLLPSILHASSADHTPGDKDPPLGAQSFPDALTSLETSPPSHESCPWSGGRPDGHAPIGVMGEHTHHKGEWMVAYRYMFMAMQENRDGTNRVPDTTVVSPTGFGFAVTPTEMEMNMHMVGLMFAPSDRLTLMGMINYTESTMSHLTRAGGTFVTTSSGMGDSSLTALYRFWDGDGTRAHFGLGLILPTAELDNADLTPLGRARLPYPMQSGAGSWGIAPSLTWLGQSEQYTWGSQLSGKIMLDDNEEGYRLGNSGELTLWGARRLTERTSVSLRTTGSAWGNISGADPAIATTTPMGVPLVPTADPERRAGAKIELAVGLNVQLPIEGARLGLEVGRPVWQDLDGPQLATDWWLVSGLQFSF